MRGLAPGTDLNEIHGIAFSLDGTKGLIFGAEITGSMSLPIWSQINMTSG